MRCSSLYYFEYLPKKDCIHISYLYAMCVLRQDAHRPTASSNAIVHADPRILKEILIIRHATSSLWLILWSVLFVACLFLCIHSLTLPLVVVLLTYTRVAIISSAHMVGLVHVLLASYNFFSFYSVICFLLSYCVFRLRLSFLFLAFLAVFCKFVREEVS